MRALGIRYNSKMTVNETDIHAEARMAIVSLLDLDKQSFDLRRPTCIQLTYPNAVLWQGRAKVAQKQYSKS